MKKSHRNWISWKRNEKEKLINCLNNDPRHPRRFKSWDEFLSSSSTQLSISLSKTIKLSFHDEERRKAAAEQKKSEKMIINVID